MHNRTKKGCPQQVSTTIFARAPQCNGVKMTMTQPQTMMMQSYNGLSTLTTFSISCSLQSKHASQANTYLESILEVFFKNFIHNEFLLLCIPLLIYFQTPQYSCIYYHAEICIFKPIYVLIEKLSSKKSLTVARRLQKLWTQTQMKLHKADLWRNTIDGVPVCCTRHTQLICTGYASNNCYFSPHCAALDKGLLFSLKSWVCPVSWTETEVLQFTILYLWDIAKDTFS